jgi:hypothetical protein
MRWVEALLNLTWKNPEPSSTALMTSFRTSAPTEPLYHYVRVRQVEMGMMQSTQGCLSTQLLGAGMAHLEDQHCGKSLDLV